MDASKTDPVNLEEDLLRWLEKAQEFLRAHVPPGTSLSDELIAERREEARREFDDAHE
jgi:hypothetical protein